MAGVAAGAAFGSVAANSAVSGAERTRSAFVKKATAWLGRWGGRRYTDDKRERLAEYKRFCTRSCGSTADLSFFAYDEDEECPVKGKDGLLEPRAVLDNADSPFNLCKERRALVRCVRCSFDQTWRLQEKKPVCMPEAYVLSELQRWACGLPGLPAEPSQELLSALEGRKRYLDDVDRYSQRHGQKVPRMAELLRALAGMLVSCGEKLKHYQCRQLLPRIHGEVVLGSLSSGVAGPPLPALAAEPAQSAQAEASSTLMSFCRRMSSSPEQASPCSLQQDLLRLVEEVREVNEQVIARYLEVSDGLPLTSLVHAGEHIATVLREGVSRMKWKLEDLREKLQQLSDQCGTWYSSKGTTAKWKEDYDFVRADIDDAHVAINRCLGYIGDTATLLSQQTAGLVSSSSSSSSSSGSVRRLRSALPPSQSKRSKL